MLIQEHKLRSLCRSESGGIDGEMFQKALDKNDNDPVEVVYEDGLGEAKIFKIPRQECEYYAQIAKEESAPEKELLSHVNPGMHQWIKYNRRKMCTKLTECMLEYKENRRIPGQGVLVVWPLFPPDQIPEEVVLSYLRRYSP